MVIAAALQAPLRGALCSACVSERLCSAQRVSIGSRIAIPPSPVWRHLAAVQHRGGMAALAAYGSIANLDRVPAGRWVTECSIGCRTKRAFQNHRISLVFWGGRGPVRLFGTPLRENCRAPLAGMASFQSEGKAEALGILLIFFRKSEKLLRKNEILPTTRTENGFEWILVTEIYSGRKKFYYS